MIKNCSSIDKGVKSLTIELALSEAGRDEIRNKIPILPYEEARRLQGPIYKVAIQELYEEGCMNAAHYFELLIAKEDSLIENKRIGVRVREERGLLFAILENVKLAERAALLQNGGGIEVTLRLLLQSVQLIETYGQKFNWLVGDLYEIFTNHLREEELAYVEYITRIRYGYGSFLAKCDETLERAIEQLSVALNNSRGHMWKVNTNDFESPLLSQQIAICLCQTLMTLAKKLHSHNLNQALEFASKAVLTMTETGIEENKELYCVAILRHSEYLRISGNAQSALGVLKKIQNSIASEFASIKSELYLQQGLCLNQLNNHSSALRKFKQCLRLSDKYDLQNLKGQALINLGKVFSNDPDPDNRLKAKESFAEATKIFVALKDMENEKRAKYLAAKIVADEILPQLVNLMNSSVNNVCDLYQLRRWKDRSQPFWNNKDLAGKQQDDELACLLESK